MSTFVFTVEIITITSDLSGRHNLGVNKDINIGKGKEYFCTKEKKSDILLRLRINTLAEYRTDSNPTFGGSHFQFSHVNLIRPSRNLRPNVKIISFFFHETEKKRITLFPPSSAWTKSWNRYVLACWLRIQRRKYGHSFTYTLLFDCVCPKELSSLWGSAQKQIRIAILVL